MAERLPHLEGINLGFCVAIAIVVAGSGLLLAGPGRTHLQVVRTELHERIAALESWASEQRRFRLPSDAERSGWAASWAGLIERVPSVPNDPELVAIVSEELNAPTVRGMQVERKDTQPWEEAEEAETLAIDSPTDGSRLELRPVPLVVSFRSAFGDAQDILGRLEAHELPARVESLRMRRVYPDVEVTLELTYFVRGGEGS